MQDFTHRPSFLIAIVQKLCYSTRKGATRIAVRLIVSYSKEATYLLAWRLLLLFSERSAAWCMATIVTIISIIETSILVTVTTMLILSSKILTFLLYFSHRHPSSTRESTYDFIRQKANRYPLWVAPILIISDVLTYYTRQCVTKIM